MMLIQTTPIYGGRAGIVGRVIWLTLAAFSTLVLSSLGPRRSVGVAAEAAR